MKRILVVSLVLFMGLISSCSFAQDKKPGIVILISEQNIDGPKAAWWASEIDLSSTEATIAQKLIQQGYEILEPSVLNKIVKRDPAFKVTDIGESQSIKLANLANADYVIVGKAVASSGGNVPASNMRSCFANLTAKLINAKDGKVIAYLDASGNAVHVDLITGGKEALVKAASDLASKLIEALNKNK
ncbi:MAG: hypothetical protein ABIH27_03025 [Candidatus Omnitrophota bacterium]